MAVVEGGGNAVSIPFVADRLVPDHAPLNAVAFGELYSDFRGQVGEEEGLGVGD